jgi:hypothetical protein
MNGSGGSPEPQRLVREFLAEREVLCPACRHNLRGVAGDRCPECGLELHLTLAVPRFESGPWLAGILGLSISLLITMTLLVPMLGPVVELLQQPQRASMVRMGFAASSDLPNWTAVLLLTAVACVLAGLLAGLVAYRRRIGRIPALLRVVIGVSAAASPLLLLVIIAIILHL